ncbi:MAG: glycosyltransferase family 2 protein [Coriobacteriales bacterium]|jgi:glycosyltransferase involved in cell wall biosynthesis
MTAGVVSGEANSNMDASGFEGHPAISVVIPVYNVEGYLGECLDSLENQTFDQIEIVCVNDGSEDSSWEILEGRASSDSRIKVANVSNGGPSRARNIGIGMATAPIISFLDADDAYEPGACEKIVRTFEQTGADVVTFGARMCPDNAGDLWTEERLSPRDIVYDGFRPSLLFEENSTPYPRTACRREFLEKFGIRFDEDIRIGEDQLFYMLAYPLSAKTVLLSDKLYIYRTNREGSSRFKKDASSPEMLSTSLEVFDHALALWKKMFPNGEMLSDVLSWSVGYVLYGIFCLDEPQRGELAAEYGSILLSYWSKDLVESCGLDKSDLEFVEAAMAGGKVSDSKALAMRFSNKAKNEGFGSTISSAFKSLLGR